MFHPEWLAFFAFTEFIGYVHLISSVKIYREVKKFPVLFAKKIIFSRGGTECALIPVFLMDFRRNVDSGELAENPCGVYMVF